MILSSLDVQESNDSDEILSKIKVEGEKIKSRIYIGADIEAIVKGGSKNCYERKNRIDGKGCRC